MTKTEALLMALEALENAEYGNYDKQELDKAITAIKEALAQPEQEPVAWMTQARNFVHPSECTKAEAELYGWTPVYTSPPKREWVGLNWGDLPEEWVGDTKFLTGARWAEQILEEKNND